MSGPGLGNNKDPSIRPFLARYIDIITNIGRKPIHMLYVEVKLSFCQ